MTPQGFQRHKTQLLTEKAECDTELGTLKNEIGSAKRTFAATGRRASAEWFNAKEARLAELKARSQELQRMLASLNAQAKVDQDLAHFVYEELLERMPREEVELIFQAAIIRRRTYLDSQ